MPEKNENKQKEAEVVSTLLAKEILVTSTHNC